jgi:hypothetical protein
MNWKDYEKEVHDYFSKTYPNASITYDAKVTGRYSKIERQVDVLIEDDVAGFASKIIIDAKYFSKNIDIKCVESFISMLQDLDANQGLMVTQKGYSKAAINRAYYGTEKLELDVLNFDEMLLHQNLAAIPYSGNNSLFLSAPFGWVVDNSKQEGFTCCLYQRGLNLKKAQKQNEWMYFKIFEKSQNVSSIKELVEKQNSRMEEIYTNLSISSHRAPDRKDKLETYIRSAKFDELTGKEVTGFIDCIEFIAFFVLFTTEQVQYKNIRKLNHLLQYSFPDKITFDNTQVIEQLESEIANKIEPLKLASAYNQLAKWYSEMGKFSDEMRYRKLCWETRPEYYENITPLILGELSSDRLQSAIEYSYEFFQLDAKNPTIMQDLLSIYEHEKYWLLFEKLINKLILKYSDEEEILGNILFHYAIHLYNSNQKTKSLEQLKIARVLFNKVDRTHQAIKQIDTVIITLATK